LAGCSKAAQRRRGQLTGVGRGYGKLHALARAMLWIAGAKAVDFDEHDQAGVARRRRRIFSAARGVGRDRLGFLIGHRDRLVGIPSECDPELSTTSTIQMLQSGWITRWSNRGLCKRIIPCYRRQDFCCAGKIDWSPYILIIRDAKIINEFATYGATEMVIAVRPYGVLNPYVLPFPRML
jgi:hypothetical protein